MEIDYPPSMKEEQEDEIKRLFNCGFDHFIDYKFNATEGMLIFGNVFMRNLAHCILTAPWRDSLRLMYLFRNECSTHELLYKVHKAKENTLNQVEIAK